MPESWAWCRLGDFCSDFQYGTASKSEKRGKTAVLRMGNLQNGELDYSDLAYTSDEIEITKYALVKNDLLFNRTNSPEWVGKTAIYRGNVPAIYAGYLIKVAPILIDPQYLNYVMNSEHHRSICYQVKTDGVNQSNINAQKLSNFFYPIPPLPEQHRIASAIASAIVIIDEIEQSQTNLQAAVTATKSKILSLAITGKLVPQDPAEEPASVLLERIRAERGQFINAGKIKSGKGAKVTPLSVDNSYYAGLPESWIFCRLSEIGEIVGGGTPSTLEQSYWDGSIPWITPADLSGYTQKFITAGGRKITECGLFESSAKLMPAKSILFSSRAPIGYCAISENKICTNQGFKSVVPFVDGMDEYIYYFLRAQVEEIRSRSSGTTFKEISGTEFGNTVFTLPPLAEQRRIVMAIEMAFEQLDSIAATLA